MRKIKILHIIKSLGRGGAEMLLPETLHLHDKNAFEFHYAYFLPWKDQMVSAIEKEGGMVKCFEASGNIKLLLKLGEVESYCKNEQIDIIHSHLPWSGFLSRGLYKKIKLPVIYTEHNIQEKYHPLTRFLNKITFNNQTMALGVSEDVTRSIKENIYPSIPVQTLFNGVNTLKFKRDEISGKKVKEEFGIPQDAFVIGNLAVFRKQKNIPLWIEAFNELQKKYDNIYGLIVGAGPEEENIKKMIKNYNLQNCIKLPGLQSDTVRFFSAMDIFMMSSDFEGLPIALLEAMSSGCAIVSTSAGGVEEVVENDKNGLLVPVGDVDSLFQRAAGLIEKPEKLKRLQLAARKRVEDAFSLQNMVNSLEEIYSNIFRNDNKGS